jgi:hypothetical protein
MFNSIFGQNVQVEITKVVEVTNTHRISRGVQVTESIKVSETVQLDQDAFVVKQLIRQANRASRMGLTDLLNSINSRSTKR